MKVRKSCISILSLFTALTAFSTEPVFEFRADGATAQDIARAIGEFYKVSVFVEPKVSDRAVTGYLREGSLDTALDTLAFFTQSSWRRSANAVYIGDQEKERYFTVPSAGLDAAAIKVIFPQSVLSGDTILVKAKPTEFSQLKEAVESMQRRHAFTARVLIADVGASFRDPVNTFLESMTAGVSITGDLLRSPSVVGTVNLNAVYDFLKTRTDVRIKTYTDYYIVSGVETELTAGNVLERAVYVRPTEAIDGAQNTLVTRYDRLQLGLTVALSAFFYDQRWFVRYKIEDADFESQSERRTAASGAIELSSFGQVKLFSLDRTRSSDTTRSNNLLSRVPLVGRVFRGKGGDNESRVLYVLIEWLPETAARVLPKS